MKKIIKYVFVLVLCILTLTSCGSVNTKNKASEEEIKEFFENKEEHLEKLNQNGYSYVFDMQYEMKEKNNSYEAIINAKSSGSIQVSPNDYSNNKFDITTTTKTKAVKYDNSGKIKQKSTTTSKLIYVDRVLYNYTKEKVKSEDYNSKSSKKTISSNYYSYLQEINKYFDEILDNANSYTNALIFIDGNKLTIVSSTYEEHCEITMKFKNNELKSIEYLIISNNNKLEMSIELCEIDSINKPSDYLEYEKEDLYF